MNDIVKDPVGYAREVVGRDPMATYLGISVDEVKEGYALCSLTIRPEYLNAVERAHGAAIHAVADQAFAVACNSMGTMAIAVNFTMNYLEGAHDGERIFAEATPIKVGRKISVWKIEVRGREDRLIASCEGVAYHK